MVKNNITLLIVSAAIFFSAFSQESGSEIELKVLYTSGRELDFENEENEPEHSPWTCAEGMETYLVLSPDLIVPDYAELRIQGKSDRYQIKKLLFTESLNYQELSYTRYIYGMKRELTGEYGLVVLYYNERLDLEQAHLFFDRKKYRLAFENQHN